MVIINPKLAPKYKLIRTLRGGVIGERSSLKRRDHKGTLVPLEEGSKGNLGSP
jgi:hypothetical protein